MGRREWEGAKEGVERLKDPLNFYLCRVDRAFETWVRLSQINENVSTKRTGKSSNKREDISDGEGYGMLVICTH